MNTLTKKIRRTWKSAQLYIGFHVDPKGRKRKTPKVWPPKNASATLHDDPLKPVGLKPETAWKQWAAESAKGTKDECR